ncbi:glycosyltransferase [Arthrobacter sp. AFG7.2]|uniref:glycosyltransferase n=1 Tax=Arthrobacter sp. AFG7.2 TaxID=1688693 RepID=UPI001670EF45|nr:glycosyltransferase [Arthrobacter sp. AFG7.2]
MTVATYGAAGSSARVRIYEWLRFLNLTAVQNDYLGGRENGLGTLIHGLPRVISAESNLRRLSKQLSTSTLLMSREASPFSNGRLESSLLAKAGHGIYDFDDAMFNARPTMPKKLWSKAKVWSAAVRSADTVIAGNDYLAEHAAKLRNDVVIIPSCVNPREYIPKSNYSLNEIPTLIWMGSPATEHYLQLIAEPLLSINAQTRIRLIIVSAGCRSLGQLDQIVERVNWSAQTFGSVLAQADIGIMPLDKSLYAQGKCAYKLLQYGAAGLPAVGSPVGANRAVIDSMGGHCATNNQEWEQSLRDLITSAVADRAALGMRARDVVSRSYSFDCWAELWRRTTGI